MVVETVITVAMESAGLERAGVEWVWLLVGVGWVLWVGLGV